MWRADVLSTLDNVKDRAQLVLDGDPAKAHGKSSKCVVPAGWMNGNSGCCCVCLAEEILAHVVHALERGPEAMESTAKALEMPSPCSPGAADYTVSQTEATKESDDKHTDKRGTEPSTKKVCRVDSPPSTELSTTNAHAAVMKLDEDMIKHTLRNLSEKADDMKQHVLERSADLRCDIEHLVRLQKEYKALKHLFKQRKAFMRDQERARRLIARSQSSADCDHVDGLCKKERRRLRRFQREQSLRLQLLQSEDARFKMKVEQQLSDLRHEYADSYLFANTFASVQ